MNRARLSLLRRLHRSLIYASLGDLIGRSVRVTSAEAALDEVIGSVRGVVPLTITSGEPALHYRAGAIAKYGILDLTYGIGSTDLPIQRPGIGILRQLNLNDGSDAGELLGDDGLLDDIVQEVEAGQLFLKLFLDSERRHAPGPRTIIPAALPPGAWPMNFVFRDACLTNAPSIWLSKHFYL